MVDLASGCTNIEIRRADEGFSWQRLDAGAFESGEPRGEGEELGEGFSLGTAAAIAATDPVFDCAAALDRLFDEGLVIGLGAC